MGEQVHFSFESQLLQEADTGVQPATMLLAAWAAIAMRQYDADQVVVACVDGESAGTTREIRLELQRQDSLADLIPRLTSPNGEPVSSPDDEVLRVGFNGEGSAPAEGLIDHPAVALCWSITSDRVEASIVYDPEQMARARAVALADQFQRLLMTVAADPGASVTSFSLLTAAEEASLQNWNERTTRTTPSVR